MWRIRGGGGDSKPQIDWIDVPALEAAGELPVGTAACLSYLPAVISAYPQNYGDFADLKVYLDGQYMPEALGDTLLTISFIDNSPDMETGIVPDLINIDCRYDSTAQTVELLGITNSPGNVLKGAYDFSRFILGVEAAVVEDSGNTDASGNPYFWVTKKNFDGDNLAEKACSIRYINSKGFNEAKTSDCQ